jgi:serine/threonine protein kinase
MMTDLNVNDFRGTARFAIVRRIGAGGMGVVYEAHDRERDVRVALKTLRRLDAKALYLFKQEFRALADVVHPNLVALHELISAGEQWFFTMELVQGVNFLDYVHGPPDARSPAAPPEAGLQPASSHVETKEPSAPAVHSDVPESGDVLQERVEPPAASADPEGVGEDDTADYVDIPAPATDSPKGKTTVDAPLHYLPKEAAASRAPIPLSPAQLRRLREALVQLVEGLCALHAAGKLHCDIKPFNVLVTPEGRVVVLDFGLVREVERKPLHAEAEYSFSGTLAYMSPEQASNLPLSPASDWYSVGVMLYLALTGQIPVSGTFMQMLRGKQQRAFRSPSALVPGLPEDLTMLCLELLQPGPEDRPPGPEILRRIKGLPAEAPAVPATAYGLRPLSGLTRAAPFVGRERHLTTLNDAYLATTQGRTVTVYVHGRSGVGKSLLVQRFLDGLAASPEVVVLAGQCYEQESVPYKALDSLVDALSRYLGRLPASRVAELLPRHMAALGRLFPVLHRVEAVAAVVEPAPEIPDPQALRRRAFGALRELLARLGDRRRLILHIDDLQWGDVDSAALLADLLRPPDPPVLCLLCAYRSEYAATSPCLTTLHHLQATTGDALDRRELAVEPLTTDEARMLAVALLGSNDPKAAAQAEAIARESGGIPYFVRELAHHGRGSAAQGHGGAAEKVTLDEVLWQRVTGLPEPARRLLEVVTVSGQPLRQGDASRAAALGAANRTALAVLRAGHLVRSTGPGEQDEVETYHDRIRESVLAHLPAATLKGLHQQLAATLEAAGHADPEALAVHFRGADEVTKAGHYYVLAADEAAQALAFDRAANLYRLALDLRPVTGAAERELRTKLGDALANAGRGPEAAREYQAVADGASALERIELERRAAYQYCISGHLDAGRAVLHTVLNRVGMRLPQTQGRALLALLWNRLRLRLRGLRFRERATGQVSDQELARIEASWSVAAGLGTKNIILAPAFQTRNLLLALRAGEPLRIARALLWEAAQVANEGGPGLPRAQILVETARPIVDQINTPYVHGLLALVRGILAFHAGRWKTGVELHEQAGSIFREQCTGVAWELGQANAFLLWCVSWMGELADMSRRSAAILTEANDKGDLFTAANLGSYIEPLARLADDEPEAAQRVIDDSIRQWSREEYNLQHFTGLMGFTYVDLYRGDGSSAYGRHLQQWSAIKKSLLLHAQICRVSLAELRARSALAVAARADDPRPLLRDADYWARRLEREKMPYAAALAKPLRAGAAALRGDKRGAARLLAEAAKAFEAVNMGLFAAAARRRLGELQTGDEGRALVDRAGAWMASQKIKNPTRMTAAMIPW